MSVKNAENMRIIEKDRKIISVINFLPKKILIEGNPVSTASIGGVCTHSDYRGRGYSSRILKDVGKRMKERGINLCMISSNRNLYKQWGAGEIKNCRRYKILSEDTPLKIKIREYETVDLPSLEKIYNAKVTRFIRNHEDFKKLIVSGTFSFGTTSYKKYILEDEDNIRGYIILKKTPEKIEVKEAGGDKNDIFYALASLGTYLGVEEIDYVLPSGETAPAGYEGTEENLSGSLKIIDLKGLIEELKPYFRQYIDTQMMESLEVEELSRGYRFFLGDEVLEIDSHEEVLKLIFEKTDLKYSGNQKKIKEFIGAVFPIPFPWTENLNYQ